MGVSPSWLMLVVAVLATYRITRFVTKDAFPPMAWVRDHIQSRWDPFDDAGWENYRKYTGEERELLIKGLKAKGIPKPNTARKSIAYLVTCAWCVSIWVGAGVAVFVALVFDIHWAWALLLWLSSSAVTGILAQREPS